MTTNRYFLSFYLLLALSSGAMAGPVFAEKVEVSNEESDSIEELELGPNQKSMVQVYLSSVLDPVRGFKVALIDLQNEKIIDTKMTNDQGNVEFFGIPPGVYQVVMRKTKKQKSLSVKIADVRIFPDKQSAQSTETSGASR